MLDQVLNIIDYIVNTFSESQVVNECQMNVNSYIFLSLIVKCHQLWTSSISQTTVINKSVQHTFENNCLIAIVFSIEKVALPGIEPTTISMQNFRFDQKKSKLVISQEKLWVGVYVRAKNITGNEQKRGTETATPSGSQARRQRTGSEQPSRIEDLEHERVRKVNNNIYKYCQAAKQYSLKLFLPVTHKFIIILALFPSPLRSLCVSYKLAQLDNIIGIILKLLELYGAKSCNLMIIQLLNNIASQNYLLVHAVNKFKRKIGLQNHVRQTKDVHVGQPNQFQCSILSLFLGLHSFLCKFQILNKQNGILLVKINQSTLATINYQQVVAIIYQFSIH
ncbi:Hypothetical_protein [Hexamita inflata]|uniref:Hypothetical_protein n=1 Tax=Hexamita inflata TaxID=28002 RepID=A0AA86V3B8_9EUKA|nr:Hypothetical protein HINF_LOCUS62341 [Hexamita inflata]